MHMVAYGLNMAFKLEGWWCGYIFRFTAMGVGRVILQSCNKGVKLNKLSEEKCTHAISW